MAPIDSLSGSAPAFYDARVQVSVVIPCHNPDARLADVVHVLSRVCGGRETEILLVDDGSDEAGRAVIGRAAEAASVPVRVITLQQNIGQRLATIRGVEAARGAYVVTIDDDGSHPAEVVPAILARLDAGAELVYAAPRVDRRPLLRRLGTAANNALFVLFLGKPLGVPVGSFRGFRRSLFDPARAHQVPYPYLSALLLERRPRVDTVRYRLPPERSRRRSRYSLGTLVTGYAQLWRYWGPLRPVRPGRRSAAEIGARR